MKLNRHSVQKIGEYLVAAECFKRGWEAPITSGTTENYDIIVHDPVTDRYTAIEVKTRQCSQKMTPPDCDTKLPEKTLYPIVFVTYNRKVDKARFFIIPVKEILSRQRTIEPGYEIKHPAWKNKWWIEPEDFIEFENRWELMWSE